MSKGQIFSSDLIMAAAVFLVLLAFASYVWDDSFDNVERKLEVNEIKHLALSITDSLVMNPGSPHNWTDDPYNARSIGIVNLPMQLSQERWNALSSLSYTRQKEILGVGRFEFWAAIKTNSGAIINTTGSYPTGDYRVGIARPVTEYGQQRTFSFVLWEEYTTPSIVQQVNLEI